MYFPILIFGSIVVIHLSLTGANPERYKIQYLSSNDVPHDGNYENRSHYMTDPKYKNFYPEPASPENVSQELDTSRADSQWHRSNVAAPTTSTANIPRQSKPNGSSWQKHYEYVNSPTTQRSQQQEPNHADSSWQTNNVAAPTPSYPQQREPKHTDSSWQTNNVAAPTPSYTQQSETNYTDSSWQTNKVAAPTQSYPQQPVPKHDYSSWQTNNVVKPTSFECQPSSSSEIANELRLFSKISRELEKIVDELIQEIEERQLYYEPKQLTDLYHNYV